MPKRFSFDLAEPFSISITKRKHERRLAQRRPFYPFREPGGGDSSYGRYRLSEYLPGYFAVGLKGWGDFILCDTDAKYFTVPTVPLSKEEIRPYSFPAETLKLKADVRFANKIKWYIKPVVFGGSPTDKENMVWITHEQHAEAMRFWNKTYFELKNKTA